jgi:hypothetical protein
VRRLLLAACLLAPAVARAEFDFAFGAGALLPFGDMKQVVDPGLDVWGRLGWVSEGGVGLTLGVDWAPLRDQDQTQSHVIQAMATPTLSLGKDLVRFWVAAGGGVVLERGSPAAPAVTGESGFDFHFFGSGGVLLSGGYTRGLTQTDVDFFSVRAGLVFTL